jgi:aminopeptidase N
LEGLFNQADVIYVGGGNTKSMLAVWREWKIDKLLKKAYNRGVVLAGVSAGAICWFEQGITDSWVNNLNVLECLGFFVCGIIGRFGDEEIISNWFINTICYGSMAMRVSSFKYKS